MSVAKDDFHGLPAVDVSVIHVPFMPFHQCMGLRPSLHFDYDPLCIDCRLVKVQVSSDDDGNQYAYTRCGQCAQRSRVNCRVRISDLRYEIYSYAVSPHLQT